MPVLRTKTCGGFPSIRGRSNRFKRASVCSFSPTGGRERRLTSSHQSVCVFLSPRRACRPKTTREGGRQRRHHLLFRPDPQLGAPQPLPGHRGPLVGLLSPPFRPAMSRRRGGEEKGGGKWQSFGLQNPRLRSQTNKTVRPLPVLAYRFYSLADCFSLRVCTAAGFHRSLLCLPRVLLEILFEHSFKNPQPTCCVVRRMI